MTTNNTFEFTVTVNSVLDRLPIDSTQITATTDPVSTVRIEGWIEEAANELSALMRSRGFTPTSIPEDVEGMMARAIRSYAASQSLKAIGMTGSTHQDIHSEYERIYSKYSEWKVVGDHSTSGTNESRSRASSRQRSSKYLDKDLKL